MHGAVPAPVTQGFGLWGRRGGGPSTSLLAWDTGALDRAGRTVQLTGPLFARVLAW